MHNLHEFRLESYFARWEFTARYHMTASDAQSMSLGELLALAKPDERAAWENLSLGYTQSQGDPILRQLIAATYDNLSPDDILCFAGAEEGMWCALHALLRPDDHCLVTVPNYQSMEEVPLSICGKANVSGVILRPENDWSLDLDDVRASLRPNTRVIAVNFPTNPTGAILSPEVFAELLKLCEERNIMLFSDEVYRGIERDPARRLPQAADRSRCGMSLNVLSKAYGFPGLRIGWIACHDRALLERMLRFKHYLSICNSAPSELLGRIILRNRELLLDRTRRLCTENLDSLGRFFDQHADVYQWRAPAGGCVGFVRYAGADGVEEHCRRLVEEAGVLLLPSSIYTSRLGAVPNEYFRVGFGRANIQEGLAAWTKHLARAFQIKL